MIASKSDYILKAQKLDVVKESLRKKIKLIPNSLYFFFIQNSTDCVFSGVLPD